MARNYTSYGKNQTNIERVQGNVSFEQFSTIGHQTIIQGEVLFEETSLDYLDDLNNDESVIPDVVNEIVRIFAAKRVLVLEREARVRTSEISRYAAYLLKQKLADSITVKEYFGDANVGLALKRELRPPKPKAVLIIPEVSFKKFGWSLAEATRMAQQFDHYILLTTNELRETWRSENPDLFYRLSYEKVKHSTSLIDELSDEQAVEDWYYNKLDSREQLLAIALSLFDGCYGSQFFAALEEIVEKVWHHRDSSLRGLDYSDLDGLRDFFYFVTISGQEESIKVASSLKRQYLLKAAWSTHRRQILSILPVLVSLVRNSVEGENLELDGSKERASRLRRSISDAVSDIGLISVNTRVVEEKMLWLASDQNIEVQGVAASALSQWRNPEKWNLVPGPDEETQENADRKLFEIIETWQEEAQIQSQVSAWLEGRDYESSDTSFDYLRSTIALTVGFSSEMDLPNCMSEKLLVLFRRLAFDTNSLVKNRFLDDTLPRVIRRHTSQLKSELRGFLSSKDFLKNPDSSLIISISKSLMEAYKFDSDQVVAILKSWYREIETCANPGLDRRVLTVRETLLSTVVLTNSLIENHTRGSDEFESLVDYYQLLAEERNAFVRFWIIFSVTYQVRENFKAVDKILKKVVQNLRESERSYIAGLLAEVYIGQRQELSGGDDVVKINGKKYPVWLNSRRPLTDVEKTLLKWAKDERDPIAQQLATRAFVNFAESFDIEEAQKILDLQHQTNAQDSRINWPYIPLTLGVPRNQGWYLGKLIPWLVTRDNEIHRTSIRNLLPEGLLQSKLDRKRVNFVLKKLSKSLDKDISYIAGRLKPGILLAENLKWGILAVALIGLGLIRIGIDRMDIARELPSRDVTDTPAVPEAPEASGSVISERISVETNFPHFDQGQLLVELSGATDEDRLILNTQGTRNPNIQVQDNRVIINDNVVGTLEGGVDQEPLVIRFGSNVNTDVVNTLLRNVAYDNISDSPKEGLRKVHFSVTNEVGDSNQLDLGVFVTAKSRQPNLRTPTGKNAEEGVPLNISGIELEDSEGTNNPTLTLSVDNGNIIASGSVSGGVTNEQISNNNSSEVIITGSAEQIMATLSAEDGIIYETDGNQNAIFKVTLDDGGLDKSTWADEDVLIWPPNSDGSRVAESDFTIAVAPSNLPPTINLADQQKTVKSGHDASFGNIVIDDPDSDEVTVTLSTHHGILTLVPSLNFDSSVLTIGLDLIMAALGMEAGSETFTMTPSISGNETNQIVLSGRLDKLQSILNSPQVVTYRSRDDFDGNDEISIQVDDGGIGAESQIDIVVEPVYTRPHLHLLPEEAASGVQEMEQPSSVRTPTPRDQTNAVIAGEPGLKNVRAGITTRAEVLFQLDVGSRITVIRGQRNQDNYLWYYIYSPDEQGEGWIASHLVDLDE